MVRAARGGSREIYSGMLSLAKVTARMTNFFAFSAGLTALYSVISSSRDLNRLHRLIYMREGSTLFRWFPPDTSIKAGLLNGSKYLNSQRFQTGLIKSLF